MKLRARLQGALELVKKPLTRFFPILGVDAVGRRFIKFAEKQWPRDPAADPDKVFLVGLVPWQEAIYDCAYVANHLARRSGAVIETYHFVGPRTRPLERVYESFGVRLGLTLSASPEDEARAEQLSRQAFQKLRTKQDVMEIRIDHVTLGDLIYDSYLRHFCVATVDIADDRLRHLIREAFLIYYATRDYLQRKKVIGMVTDDYSYLNVGIPTRLLALAGVPIYRIVFGEHFYVFQLEYACADHNVPCLPYYRFRDMFREMPAADQDVARARGRALLEERLSGKLDQKTLQTTTAYGTATGRVLEETGRPRILIMLHDFIDAPHSYRWLLFPDFFEWICFLLEKAQETPFDWYVKAHPSSGEKSRTEIYRVNCAILDKLKAMYPKIRFLDPTTSNRQIIADGVNAMFTVHGTGAHEFAYMGIPVVNAGDNPHIQYDFNIHATSREEYAAYIAQADRLQVEVDKAHVEELCYMYYLHGSDRECQGANPIDPEIYRTRNIYDGASAAQGFDLFMSGATEARERELNEYLDGFPRKSHAPELREKWATIPSALVSSPPLATLSPA